jgi:hypothetical protein
MRCKTPFRKDGIAYGCGRCLPCRIKKRSTWTHRILLEATQHKMSAFITLTYDEENLPKNGSLVKEHHTKFMKDLRSLIYPKKIRYFMVGEYGETTERPHYHYIIFGLPTCLRGRTDHRKEYCCQNCDPIKKIWKKGSVDLGELNSHSAQYIGGYVTKKMTNPKDKATQEWLKGRVAEFSRQSLKPGIGAKAMETLAEDLNNEYGNKFIDQNLDVPTTLIHGKRKLPLGRYLRQKLRENVGFKDEKIPEEALTMFKLQAREDMEKLFKEAKQKKKKVDQVYKDKKEANYRKIVNKYKLYKKKGNL